MFSKTNYPTFCHEMLFKKIVMIFKLLTVNKNGNFVDEFLGPCH